MTQITYYAYTKYALLLSTPAEPPERVPTPTAPAPETTNIIITLKKAMTMKTNITKFCARAAATLAFPLKRLPVALLMMLTTATGWADGISYLDATGTQQSCTTYTTVESSSTSWNSGWCVVNSNTTISDRITVSGTVNLILCDGATLTASKGITVGSSATFNVYAQSDDEATMGALVASGANDNQQYNAGIGGVDNTAAGTITINGGKINATGMVGAGIGSGGQSGATVGTITINGGIVTAQDGSGYGAGIGGGGIQGKAGTINLNGGIINAAGIGSGYLGGDCSITVNISDGIRKIVATPVQGGACIGKGASASGSVTVNFKSGGNVVTGDDKDAVFYDTGEGSQRQIRAKAMNHAVTMSDDLKANITATSEYAFTGETVTLTLGTAVDATTLSVNGGAVATTDAGNRQYTFTMPDEDVTVTATLLQTYAVSLPANMEVVSATDAADADGKYITGTTVTFMASFPYAASNVSDGTSTLEPDANGIYTVTVADADITVTATVERSATIDLSDANGDFNAIEGDVLTGTTSHTVTIADGAGITLSGATINGSIVCAGSAEITLVGTNNVSNTRYSSAGIQIGGSGTTLTIKGDGSLTATGGSQAAGIGLGRTWDDNATGGSIVIEGGTITANGSNGIGTGTVGNSKTASIDGISIKGGTVNASLGKGYIYNGCTATVGYIKIYDTIDMVDASKITESVTYMHDDTDVTASASTYFTISENGDRRIIVPKDDTDYTITIADGIEHGTITGATTAKYMETVTINATPDFGYRLVRLVVKDADDNDVASTGNTFLMPKSNVTVSAVFEQGTHGTTEFVWGYYGLSGFVNEATIYDGVTTVNLQTTGQSYNILKYENEYNYYNFRLDNDTYEADIPYAGGTGEFQNGNGTNFSLPYDGETGYYDITMTDAGNGKWSVSIQKTVGQMDVVPDQTYTGSAITPEPTVVAGSLSLTKGMDYTYSYTDNTNVGTATVRATFQGDYASLGYVERTFTIGKGTPTVTAPTAIDDLIYNGSAQALVTAGSTDFGTLLYSLDGNTYAADIPTATDAANYTVYYKVEATDNWNAVDAATVAVSIAAKAVTVTADDQTKEYGQSDPTLTATVEGLIDEDAIAYSLSRTEGEAVGTYDITPAGDAAQGNYAVTYVAGTMTITSNPTLTLTANLAPDENYWTTFYCGDAGYTIDDGENACAYTATYAGTNVITLHKLGKEIPAGTAVIIVADNNEVSMTEATLSTFSGDNALRGVDVETSTADIQTRLGSGTFYVLGMKNDHFGFHRYEGTEMAARKAFVLVNGTGAALARSLTMVFDDATGITTTNYTNFTNSDDAWYSLDGQRLMGKPAKSGIYINNGKKIVIK